QLRLQTPLQRPHLPQLRKKNRSRRRILPNTATTMVNDRGGNMKKNKTGGNTTVLTLIIVTVLASFIAATLMATTGTARNAQRSRAYKQTINVGLGCFEMAFSGW